MRQEFETRLNAVRVADVCSYLSSKGWRRADFARREMLRFEGPEDDTGVPIVQLVPAKETLLDFRVRMRELLESLSAIEQRSPTEVLENIVTPTSDILRVRLDTSITRTGSLPLGFASRFVENLRNLLVFAACGEVQGRPYYERALKQGTEFANKCCMAATEKGSFVAVVESPVTPPANQEQVALKAYPYERRVMFLLAEGLALVEDATASGMTDKILKGQRWTVNGNMCEAILGLKPDEGDATLDIGISWSHAWPVEDDIPQRIITYAGKSFEQIASVARALRLGDEPQRRTVRGRVVKLAADDPVHGGEGNMVATLRAEGADDPKTIHLLLDREDYRRACNAHRDGNLVAATGILDRDGRRWMLSEVCGVSIVGQDNEE